MPAHTKAEISAQLHTAVKENQRLRLAGQMCANVCYNLANRDYTLPDDARSMTKAYKAWDEATKAKTK